MHVQDELPGCHCTASTHKYQPTAMLKLPPVYDGVYGNAEDKKTGTENPVPAVHHQEVNKACM